MNILLVTLCAIGLVYSLAAGDVSSLSLAAADSAENALKLWLTVAAAMMLWSGLMRVAEKAGIVDRLCQTVRPLLRLLLRDLPPESPAMKAAAMNFTSNLLGLGNAALPFGLRAMKELETARCSQRTMAAFILLNTASVQLVPMNIITLRAAAGSPTPSDCVLPILFNSLLSLTCGLLAVCAVYSPALSPGKGGKIRNKKPREERAWNYSGS